MCLLRVWLTALLRVAAPGMQLQDSTSPFMLTKKHWIGVCVDFTTAKIYILDCNSAVRSDFDLTRDLLPISEIFPFLLKNCGLLDVPAIKPLSTERVRGVAQKNNLAYSALTAALLIQTHAMFAMLAYCCMKVPNSSSNFR